ncbi:ASCH domain-containing protein [Polycladomyces sp. WAk]|uniref:ASCH domain-containing protein n=1 Tax=Polycladomyces zharkentensis TaxID=2807616 RepID=A0ABS2WH59_9BACL|nr:ASCH domain-containing protein [Polycladomyces sp. WAk]MBN2908853.1 ASCH domain-containing protein [Polycladomyces sp. WAk]
MIRPLPPKTCSIDRLVTREADVEKVLSGDKHAARRNGRYADPGETLELRGQRFSITAVYRQKLGEMTDTDARSEGFPDLDAYREYILSLHPGMRWVPSMEVWVHEWSPVT